MTHTLHRRENYLIAERDFVILAMAAKKFNEVGSGKKLKEIFKILLELGPDNIAEEHGGIYTGKSSQEILEGIGDNAYVAAAFSSEKQLEEAVRRLKEANLGISVVVSGNFSIVFSILKRIGLRPHTVNMSLGTFGNTKILPRKEVLEITTMCGHCLVTPKHVEIILRRVQTGKMTPSEGAIELASPCTCGIFNPKRGEMLIKRFSKGEE